MSDWAGGYFTGRAYPRSFWRETAPAFLACLLALRGRRVPDFARPFRFLDLGCGSGSGAALLAAANPQGEFIGVDFSPDHILEARALAEAAGLSNLHFLEAGFADLLEAGEAIGTVDVLVCHGVYTWVGAEQRRAIVEIMRRHVATGGLVYVGYNAMPGWAPMMPFRHLVQRLAEGRPPAGAESAMGEARAILEALRAEQAGYMRDNGPVARRLDAFDDGAPGYLAHEYLPAAAGALWHDEVARDLAEARLSYLGAAQLAENFDSINIAEPMRARVAEAEAQGVGEIVRDLVVNQSFRMDVFTRGSVHVSAAEAGAAFEGVAVALTAPPPEPPVIRTAQGEMALSGAVAEPVLESLAEGPATVGDLVARGAGRGLDAQPVRQVVTALLAGGIVSPVATLAPSAAAAAACDAFNRVVLTRARDGRPLPALASPLLGSGIPVGVAEQRALAGADPRAGWDAGDAEAMRALDERLAHFEARRPYLRQLGATGAPQT